MRAFSLACACVIAATSLGAADGTPAWRGRDVAMLLGAGCERDDDVACALRKRYGGDAKAAASALALYDGTASIAGLGVDEQMDGGYRGRIHLVPELPVGRYRAHVARVVWAMAHDGLFFRRSGALNRHHVPAVALLLQGVWASLLILPRTRLHDASGTPLRDPATGLEQYGNVYSNLLDYVVFAVLIFYILTIAGLFVLRRKRPDAERPYRAFGYPVVPVAYILAAALIATVLLVYKTQTTWPGLAIVLTGVPVYFAWRRFGSAPARESAAG